MATGFYTSVYWSAINSLYLFTNELEWYTWLLLVLQFVAFIQIGISALHERFNSLTQLVLLIFIWSLFLRFNIHVQFTKIAGISALAGMLVLFEKGKTSLLGFLLVGLGLMVRFKPALMVIVLGIAPAFYLYFNKDKRNSILKLGGLVLLIFLIRYSQEIIYRQLDNQWQRYFSFNAQRTLINDNPIVHGGVAEDYLTIKSGCDELFVDHFFSGSRLLTHSVLNELVRQLNCIPFSVALKTSINQLYSFWPWCVVLCIFTLGLLFDPKKKVIQSVLMLLPFILGMAGLLYLGTYAILKHRVFILVLGSVVFFPLLFGVPRIKKLSIAAVLILALGVTFGNARAIWNKRQQNEMAKSQNELLNQFYSEANQGGIIVFEGDYKVEYQNPFSMSNWFVENPLIFNGWMAHYPLNKSHAGITALSKKSSLFISLKSLNLAQSKLEKCLSAMAGGRWTFEITHRNEHGIIGHFSRVLVESGRS
ncbi:hypothetical protein [Luteibaculum oceani]|uniref:Glycosyltransferase RgtA/B/C/D-like domain-containing protein n=1 Tax=Luteibaculum oceani TaxID=1294296 RepID=A0A5C6VIZ8_9FLAO|nr:hypothetical protein [Luteibaculum oceani]TXC85463.1 hypothetical protein FRX97_02205 [Luteibaculum oceani]